MGRALHWVSRSTTLTYLPLGGVETPGGGSTRPMGTSHPSEGCRTSTKGWGAKATG